MKFTPFRVNLYVFLKIPSAFLSGVRVKSLHANKTVVGVKFRWINQNPFKSMYWATQGMASELATGLLVMQNIDNCSEKISMLVTGQKGTFHKKAVGKILFNCEDGGVIQKAINLTLESGEGEKIVLVSKGIDEKGDVVSAFEYEWSLKVKR